LTKFCAACGQPNERYRTRCYCGFSLDPTNDDTSRELASRTEAFVWRLVLGTLAIVAGFGVMVWTSVAAERGVRVPVIVPFGAVVVGFVLVIHGFWDWREAKSRLRKQRDQG
jgi:uncharacterized membrane protein HdeD (DUF308 family)